MLILSLKNKFAFLNIYRLPGAHSCIFYLPAPMILFILSIQNAPGRIHVALRRVYTRSRITRTRLYRIIAYFEGHLPHQKSLH